MLLVLFALYWPGMVSDVMVYAVSLSRSAALICRVFLHHVMSGAGLPVSVRQESWTGVPDATLCEGSFSVIVTLSLETGGKK